MIRVIRRDPTEATTEALAREARSDGAAISATGRNLEARLGAEHGGLLLLDDAPTGSAFLTPAGSLPVAFLIHIVLQSPEEPVTAHAVQRGLTNALRRAAAFGIRSLTLPALGVGAGKLEAEQSAEVVIEVLAHHLEEGGPPVEFEIAVASEYEEEVFRRRAGSWLAEGAAG